MRQLSSLLRTRPEDVVGRIESLLDERRQLERQLADAKRQLALGGGGASAGEQSPLEEINGVKLLTRSVSGLNPKDLRGLVDDGKKQVESGVVAIVGVTDDGKAGLAVGVTKDLTEIWNAVELVRAGSEALGGKGGGGGGRTWPRPAGPTVPRPMPRSRRSALRWHPDCDNSATRRACVSPIGTCQAYALSIEL